MSTKSNPVTQKESPFAVPPQVSNSRGLSAVYANNVGVSATVTDFTLFFIETGQLPSEKGTSPYNDLRAAVTLPMAMAGAITDAIGMMLANTKVLAEQQKAAMQRKSSGPQ
jgi:hypothetical protein